MFTSHLLSLLLFFGFWLFFFFFAFFPSICVFWWLILKKQGASGNVCGYSDAWRKKLLKAVAEVTTKIMLILCSSAFQLWSSLIHLMVLSWSRRLAYGLAYISVEYALNDFFLSGDSGTWEMWEEQLPVKTEARKLLTTSPCQLLTGPLSSSARGVVQSQQSHAKVLGGLPHDATRR